MAVSLSLHQQQQRMILKCRKCRFTLFDRNPVTDSHGNENFFAGNEGANSLCSLDEGSVWYIKEEFLPDWLFKYIDEASWIKGKLKCPKCDSRLGSFDFVSGHKCKCGECVLPPIHIVKSKVDSCLNSYAKETSVTPDNRSSGLICINYSGKTLCEMNLHEKPYLSPGDDEISKRSEDINFANAPQPSTLEDAEMSISSDESNKYSSIVPDNESIKESGSLIKKRTNKCSKSTSLNEQVTEDLICPVCLELYFEAMVCHPCGHIFCDPCLRNIGRKQPTATSCPLCRQLIQKCLPQSEIRKKTYAKFPQQYKDRKLFEQTSQSQNLPLPWQHGVRFSQFEDNGDTNSDANPEVSLWNSLLMFFSDYPSSEVTLTPSSLIVIFSLVLVFIITLFGGYLIIKFMIVGFLELSSNEVQCIILISLNIVLALFIKNWYYRLYA